MSSSTQTLSSKRMSSPIETPSGTIVGRKLGANFMDIILQTEPFIGQEGIVFISDLPEVQEIDIDKLIGVKIAINRVRMGDRKVISNALAWRLQPDELKKIVFGAESSQKQQDLDFERPQQELGGSKRVSGKIRDPRTEKCFEKLMVDRIINQTEAVELCIRHGLLHMGYEA